MWEFRWYFLLTKNAYADIKHFILDGLPNSTYLPPLNFEGSFIYLYTHLPTLGAVAHIIWNTSAFIK